LVAVFASKTTKTQEIFPKKMLLPQIPMLDYLSMEEESVTLGNLEISLVHLIKLNKDVKIKRREDARSGD